MEHINSVMGFFVYLNDNHTKCFKNPYIFRLKPGDSHVRYMYSITKIYEEYKRNNLYSTLSSYVFMNIVTEKYTNVENDLMPMYHISHKSCSFVNWDSLITGLKPNTFETTSDIDDFFKTLEFSHRDILKNPFVYKSSPNDYKSRCLYDLDKVYSTYKDYDGKLSPSEFMSYLFEHFGSDSNNNKSIILYGDKDYGGLSFIDTEKNPKLDIPAFNTKIEYTLPCNIYISDQGTISVVSGEKNILSPNINSLTKGSITYYYNNIQENLFQFIESYNDIIACVATLPCQQIVRSLQNKNKGSYLLTPLAIINFDNNIRGRYYNFGTNCVNFYILGNDGKYSGVYIINGSFIMGTAIYISDPEVISDYIKLWNHYFVMASD